MRFLPFSIFFIRTKNYYANRKSALDFELLWCGVNASTYLKCIRFATTIPQRHALPRPTSIGGKQKKRNETRKICMYGRRERGANARARYTQSDRPQPRRRRRRRRWRRSCSANLIGWIELWKTCFDFLFTDLKIPCRENDSVAIQFGIVECIVARFVHFFESIYYANSIRTGTKWNAPHDRIRITIITTSIITLQ